jgi:hypothetical protein
MRKGVLVGVVVLCVLIAVGLVLLRSSDKKAPARREIPQRARQEQTTVAVPAPPLKGVLTEKPRLQTGRRLPPRVPTQTRQLPFRESEPALPENIRLIIGDTDKKGDDARLDAVHLLPRNLQPHEIDALYRFLNTRFETQGDLSLLAFNGIKNDILDALLNQEKIPEDLGRQMTKMYRDRTFDNVWRGYCIQHFPTYYQIRWGAESVEDSTAELEPDRKQMIEALWDSAAERRHAIAGVGLVALESLSRQYAEIDKAKVGQLALEIAQDPAASVDARTTAIQICAMTGKKEIVPAARILAQTGSPVPLRLSAIAVLGQVGTEQDKELLESIAVSSDKYPRKAADKALKALNGRLGQKQ